MQWFSFLYNEMIEKKMMEMKPIVVTKGNQPVVVKFLCRSPSVWSADVLETWRKSVLNFKQKPKRVVFYLFRNLEKQREMKSWVFLSPV